MLRSSFRALGRPGLLLVALALSSAVICSAASHEAFAQSGAAARRTNLMETGRRLFEEQRYEESIQTFSAALLRPSTSKQDRIEVYRYLAYNYLVLSQMEEAGAAVRGLYVIDPDFELDSSESPRFRTFFEEVKKQWEEEGRPGFEARDSGFAASLTVKHVSPAEWEEGKQFRVTGKIIDPGNQAAGISIRYRTGSKGKFKRLEARLSRDRFRASIPGSAVKAPLVEYYIEVLDDGGLPIATRGDAAAPMRIAVPDPDQGSSMIASPWFWVAAAAVVGAGVTGAILLNDDSGAESSPSGPPTSRVVVVIGN